MHKLQYTRASNSQLQQQRHRHHSLSSAMPLWGMTDLANYAKQYLKKRQTAAMQQQDTALASTSTPETSSTPWIPVQTGTSSQCRGLLLQQ